MPQLEFSNPLILSQVVWMALIFGALYFILARWALPQVASVLDERAARIASDLESARLAKTQADGAVAELNAATHKASSEAQAEIASAVATAKAEAAEQSRVANERLDVQLQQAEQRIATARNAAMGALREVATDTAATMVAKLTGMHADGAAVAGAVNTALAARG